MRKERKKKYHVLLVHLRNYYKKQGNDLPLINQITREDLDGYKKY